MADEPDAPRTPSGAGPPATGDPAVLAEICAVVRQHTGHDFSSYKTTTLFRRLERRMQARRSGSPGEYLRLLHEDPAEASALKGEFLIGVTQFFRDADAFAALENEIIVRLGARLGAGPIRAWVPGCSTGEEAYSLAILFAEARAANPSYPEVQIFATDIDPGALDVARLGRYRAEIERDVSRERLTRFFLQTSDGYQVRDHVREMCLFSEHNLLSQPPFSRLDLVSCRNLFIYFEPKVQAALIPVFHYALAPSGYLFLGAAEGIAGFAELFHPIDKRHRIFQRRGDASRPVPSFSVKPLARVSAQWDARLATQVSGERELARTITTELLENHAPPAVVINAQAQILFYSGKTGGLLDRPTGTPTNSLFDLVDRSIRPEVHALVHRAMRSGETGQYRGLAMKRGDLVQRLDVTVRPFSAAGGGATLYLVVFQEIASPRTPDEAAREGLTVTSRDSLVEQLELELRDTREHLQSTIEEVKSSNEELLSTNEELQSANEELQTSREELQSLNEELEAVNLQLSRKVEELDHAHSDLQNFFENTRVPTLFLSNDLHIVKFTPAADQVFRLIASDVGRPISDIASVVDMRVLVPELTECARTLRPIERQVVASDESRSFLMRANPYRTANNVIGGVVVTFSDVTELTRAKERETALAAIVESSSDAIVGRGLDGEITSWNEGAARLLWYTAHEAIGRPFALLLPPELQDQMRDLEARIGRGEHVTDFETEILRKDRERLQVSLTISPIRGPRGAVAGVSLIFRDISERKRAELASARLAAIVHSSEDAIVGKTLDGVVQSWNQGAERLFGYTAEEMIGTNIRRLMPPEQPDDVSRILDAIRRGERVKHYETVRVHKNGRRINVSLTVSPVKDASGRIVGASKIARDISDRVQLEAALKRGLELRDEFISIASHELKTPLTSMKLQVDTVRRALARSDSKATSPERFTRFVEQAHRSLERLNRLIEDMLDVSRMGTRGLVLAREPVDLGQLAHDVATQLSGYLATSGYTVSEQLQPDVTGVWDRMRLEQVVINLLTNACRYGAGKPIGMRVTGTDELARFEVTDQGIGIAPEHHDRVFRRFERVSSEGTPGDGGGFGIGLYIVREVVNAHGGSIEVRSALGQGATFIVTLPRRERNA